MSENERLLLEALRHAAEAIGSCDCIMTHGGPDEYDPKREFWKAVRLHRLRMIQGKQEGHRDHLLWMTK